MNASRIGTRTVSTSAPLNSQVLGWNTSNNDWEPISTATGSVSSVVSGTGLVAGTITNNGTINVDVGTTGNKIVQLNALAQYPADDGYQITNVNASRIGTRTVSTSAPLNSQVLGWNTSNNDWEPISTATGSVSSVVSGTGLVAGTITNNGTINVDVGTAANKILQMTAADLIPAVDGSLVTNVNAVRLQSRAVSTLVPTANQVLRWNSLTTAWEPSTDQSGTVVSISTGNGLLGGPITSNGTLTVDVGTTGNKIVQLNAIAQYPADDGYQITNVNASRIGTRTVSTSAPLNNQVLGWNTSNNDWEPISTATGSVSSVVSGTGLVAGTITNNGTINVDVGTTGNKIVQLNALAQYPADDGYQITNVNASRIGTRTVSTSAPLNSQVLGWNTSNNDWEPISTATGSVSSVVSGTGLVAGTITNNGTINVDVGTTGNKIVQLNALAQYPADDGYQITNVNASRIGTRTVSTSAPLNSQVLGWNTSNNDWEPISTATGSVSSVVSGTGLVAGTITNNGTINVDVGTAANKILQMTAADLIPAVDGSLVTNVNAVKLQSRAVSALVPTANQVLRWNSLTTAWEPSTDQSGTVVSVSTGNGLLGGPITSNGTLTVDVGTTGNKIVQLNALAQYPADDGYQITNVNASRIGTRTVSTSAPLNNQVLGWNTSNNDWEPISTATGSVSSVVSGTGLVAGTITNNGTINVDVGTTGNKIVQLNALAQ